MKNTLLLPQIAFAHLASLAVSILLAASLMDVHGATPVVGDIVFNEYAADNDANGNDFVELLTLTNDLDLRGLRIADNELVSGALNTNESVIVFGSDSYLNNVPQGTLIAVWTIVAGVTTDTTVNPAASDWKMVLAPGTGVTLTEDGLGGSVNAGFATGGEALYLYLPGTDGTSAGTDNVYLDFVSFESDGGEAPAGFTDLNLASVADNAYYTGNTAAGNELTANWVRYDFTGTPASGGANTTPGEPNPTQDLSAVRGTAAAPGVTLVESSGNTAVTESGATDSFTVALNTTPTGSVTIQASADAQIEISADGTNFSSMLSLVFTDTAAQTVTVRAVDDLVAEAASHTGTIQHAITASGDTANYPLTMAIASVSVSIAENDGVPGSTRIHDVQGAAHVSLLAGQTVTNVPGIVTVARANGFYFQDPTPDGNPATSEGLFVFTSSTPTAAAGDAVLVSGTVSEFRPGGDATNLTATELTSPSVVILSSGNALPAATIIGAGGRVPPAQTIDDDAVAGSVENTGGVFDPDQDGIDFYESLEGMRVQIDNAVAVSPRNEFGEIFVLADDGAGAGLLTPRGGIVIQPGDFNPERILLDDTLVLGAPEVNVGDLFSAAIVGVMDYGFGNFRVLNTAALPAVISGGLTRETTALVKNVQKLTVATLNVENLDPNDAAAKFAALASIIVTNLAAPDVINLEEVQDNNGPTNNGVVDADTTLNTLIAAIQTAGGPQYQYRQINPVNNQDGGETGGNIRVAFLFNPARVQFVDRAGGDSTTAVTVASVGGGPQLSFSPGRIAPTDSAFASSRKPLAGEFLFNNHRLFVIGNHLASKGGDQPLFGKFQPPTLTTEAQRLQQAQIVKDFVASILTLDANANVIVLGDLNDFEFSGPLVQLKSAGLIDLVETLPAAERYSYNFEGNSQTLDHILVSGNLTAADEVDVVHVNAEFTIQDSDHDPVVARFALELPLVLTELQSNQASGSTSGDYWELTNVGTTSIDLSNWKWDDDSLNPNDPAAVTIPAGTSIAAGESIIFTGVTAAAFRAWWGINGSVQVIGIAAPGLGGGDKVGLFDAAGTQIFAFSYAAASFTRADGSASIGGHAGLSAGGTSATQALVLDPSFGVGTGRRYTAATVGTFGAFAAAGNATEIGSPGVSGLGGGAPPAITLSVSVTPGSFAESAANPAASGTVTRTGSTAADLVVNLSSSDTTEATVPATVTILASQTSATFNVTAINDSFPDGNKTVTITASATDATAGTFDVTVQDDGDVLTTNLMLTEILSNQSTGAPADADDYWELTNFGASTVDLTGYSWHDSGRSAGAAAAYALPAGSLIDPNESVIFTSIDPTVFRAWWGLPTSVKVFQSVGAPGLGQNDGVSFFDEGQNELFFFSYAAGGFIREDGSPSTGTHAGPSAGAAADTIALIWIPTSGTTTPRYTFATGTNYSSFSAVAPATDLGSPGAVSFTTPYSNAGINVLTPNTAAWNSAGVTVNGTTFINLGLQGVGRVPANAIDSATGESIGSVSDMQVTGWKKNANGSYSGTFHFLPDRGYNSGTIFSNYAARINEFGFTFTPYTSATPTTAQDQIAMTFLGSTRFTYDRAGTPTFTTGLLANNTIALFGVLAPAAAVDTTQSDGTVANRLTVDSEGLVLDTRAGKSGSGWLSDEYGPYIYHFNSAKQIDGQLQLSAALLPHKPAGTVSFVDTNVNGRRTNQGMEGLAQSPDGTKLFALLQSATLQDSGAGNQGRFNTRLLVYDVSTSDTPGDPIAQYAIQLPRLDSTGSTANGTTVDRTGAQSAILALNDHQILILSRDGNGRGATGAPVFKSILLADLSTGTDIDGTYDAEAAAVAPGGTLAVDVTPISWTEALNMIGQLGAAMPEVAKFNLNLNDASISDANSICEKWEGLALVSASDPANPNDYFLFVGNDNDFLSSTGKYMDATGAIQSYDAGLENDTLVLVWRVRMTGSYNQAPFAATSIPDRTATPGMPFSVTVAANTFTDPEGQTLTYSATKADDSALPAWLSFNPASRTFSGTPGAGDLGTVVVKVMATDNGTPNLSGGATFAIVVNFVYSSADSDVLTPNTGAWNPVGVTIDGTTFVNLGLQGVGRVPANAIDPATGESVGSVSDMQITDWKKNANGSYSGAFHFLPDRGYNSGTIFSNYAARINEFGFTFTPYTSATPTTAQDQIAMSFLGSTRFTYDRAGTPTFTTGLLANNTIALFGVLAPAAAVDTTQSDGTVANRLTVDSEGLVLDTRAGKSGSGWLSDEYGPYIYHFDSAKQIDGQLQLPAALLPHKPAGTLSFVDTNVNGRRTNQGMEGLAQSPDGTKLFALLQSATLQDSGSGNQGRFNTRLLVYDVSTTDTPGDAIAQYAIQLPRLDSTGSTANGTTVDRTGAQSAILALNNHQILILSRDGNGRGATGAPVFKSILLADLSTGTDIDGMYDAEAAAVAPGGTLAVAVTPIGWTEALNMIGQLGAGSPEVAKFNLNLNDAAISDANSICEKWEGLALVSAQDPANPNDYFLFVGNDNDFLSSTGKYMDASGAIQSYDAGLDNDTVVLAWRVRMTGSFNQAPFAATSIPDRTATPGMPFSVTVAANTFTDPEGQTLTYSATKADDTALPAWLSFNASTRTFSGTPAAGDTGTLSVKVTATDTTFGAPPPSGNPFDPVTPTGASHSIVILNATIAGNPLVVDDWIAIVDEAGITGDGSVGVVEVAAAPWQPNLSLAAVLSVIPTAGANPTPGAVAGHALQFRIYDASVHSYLTATAVIAQGPNVFEENITFVSVNGTPNLSGSATLTLQINAGTAAPSLIVSEVAPWSSGNSPVAADWFEVTNTGFSAVDISGWKLDDSSNAFATALTLSGIASIAPGESVIFLETSAANPAATVIASFKSVWFGANVPAGLQFGTYQGSGIGLSTDGDAVNLFDSNGIVRASVSFGAAPAGPSFPTFDNAVGLNNAAISELSVVGVYGAFAAVNDPNEKGSPGVISSREGIDLARYVRVGRYDLPEPTRTPLPAGTPASNLMCQEASGVAYNWDTDTLFIVGDGGRSVTQVSKTGVLIDTMTLALGGSPQGTEFYDTEGITYVGGGQFVMSEERDRQLVLFTYAAGTTLTRSAAKTVKLGTFVPNIGLEGLSYDPYTGGYICVKEALPVGIFQTDIDFDAGTATNGSPTTENSIDLFDPALASLLDLADVFALSNLPSMTGDPQSGNLLVLSQESAKIVNTDRSGTISSSLQIVADPGSPLAVADLQHEGLTMDGDGYLYVVNENGGGDIDHPQLWVYAPSATPNQAPTAVALNNPVTAIVENASTTSRVKVADIGVTDDGLGMNDLTLTGADVAFLEIVATALYIKAGTVLDYETKTSYSVTINVDDPTVGATPDATTTYTLAVTDVVDESAPISSLIVSEVAPWSSGSSPVATDWFEVTNIGATAVDIAGWKVDDSSASFAAALTLNGVTSIAPGESVIFLETSDTNPATTVIANFKSVWFGANVPVGLQIGSYQGGSIGLSTGGDAVNLYDGSGTARANVSFGASPPAPFPTFDNAAGLNNAALTRMSIVGLYGAFVAANDIHEIGSPGTIGGLIFSEVAPWSSGSSPVAADWFEVTNTSAMTINIAGWKMDDNSESPVGAVALNGISSIAPGESVIFLETTTPAATIAGFLSTWFGANPPAGLQVGSYTGSGVGLGTSGDAVNLYDSSNTRRANVSFGASPTSAPFATFDNAAGRNNVAIAQLSVVSVNGAFVAANDANEIASPGIAANRGAVAINDAIAVHEGAVREFSVAANGTAYFWSVNGAAAGGNSATLLFTPGFDFVQHPSQLVAGVVVHCTITRADGLASVTWTNVTVHDVDRAPTAPTVAIPGAPFHTLDDLEAVLQQESVDPDGDVITGYVYLWGNNVLDGAQEAQTPPVATPAQGSGLFIIDTAANTLEYQIVYRNLIGIETAAHIHGPAPAGMNADVLHTLPAGRPKVGVWNYTEAQETDILMGRTYVNIHSQVFPLGEIRGQIVPIRKEDFNLAARSVVHGRVLPHTATRAGDFWTVSVWPMTNPYNAGEMDSPVFGTAMSLILNTPPTLAEAVIQSDTETITEESILSAVAVGAVDVDDDPISFRYDWFVNGAPVPHAFGPTLRADDLEAGDLVMVAITPTDRKNPGAPVTSQPVVIQPEPSEVWAVFPQTVNFGQIATQRPNPAMGSATVMIENISGETQAITAASINAPTKFGFRFDLDSDLGGAIEPGEFVVIHVQTNSVAIGANSGQLLLTTSGGAVPVPLMAHGVASMTQLEIGSHRTGSLVVGDEFAIPLFLHGNNDLSNLAFDLMVDGPFDLIGFERNNARLLMDPLLSSVGGVISFGATNFLGNVVIEDGDGEIGRLIFEVIDDVEIGVFPIRITGPILANDTALNETDVAGLNGELLVAGCQSCKIKLDVDNDGVINFRDVVFTFRVMFNHPPVPTGVVLPPNETAATVRARIDRLFVVTCDGYAPLDMDLDGQANFRDIVFTFRHMFGHPTLFPGVALPPGVTVGQVDERIQCIVTR